MTAIKDNNPPIIPPAWLAQAAKFLSVGVLNTIVDAGLYFALTRWLGLAALPVLAKSISYAAGLLNSYYWNKTWTFKGQAGGPGRLIIFALTNTISLAINAGVMSWSIQGLGLPELLSLILATTAAFGWNFLTSKWIVFAKANDPAGEHFGPRPTGGGTKSVIISHSVGGAIHTQRNPDGKDNPGRR